MINLTLSALTLSLICVIHALGSEPSHPVTRTTSYDAYEIVETAVKSAFKGLIELEGRIKKDFEPWDKFWNSNPSEKQDEIKYREYSIGFVAALNTSIGHCMAPFYALHKFKENSAEHSVINRLVKAMEMEKETPKKADKYTTLLEILKNREYFKQNSNLEEQLYQVVNPNSGNRSYSDEDIYINNYSDQQ